MAGVNVSDNRYGVAKLIVSPNLSDGANYTTIAAALTAASANDTIFIRNGTYTEDLTLRASINLAAFNGSQTTPNVTIVGKATATFAGTCSISGIRLKTNGDFALVISGSAATVVNLNNCYLDIADNTFFSFTTSSSSARVNFTGCNGDILTGATTFVVSSSAGIVSLKETQISNTVGSTTASTFSAGQFALRNSLIAFPVSTSGATARLNAFYSEFNTNSINTTAITHNSTATNCEVRFARIASGTATAIDIGAGARLQLTRNSIASSNATQITINATGNAIRRENYFYSNSTGINGLGIGTEPTAVGELVKAQLDQNSTTSIQVFNRNNTAAQTTTATKISLGCKKSSDSNLTEAGMQLGNDLTNLVGGAGTQMQNRLLLFSNAECDGITVLAKGSAGTLNLRVGDGSANGKEIANCTNAGEWTQVLQPCFLAYNSVNDANQTGNGAIATVEFDTEIFDQGGDFNNTTDTFTAPVTGRYHLEACIGTTSITAAMTQLSIDIVTSNRKYRSDTSNNLARGNSVRLSVIADMDAGDTALIQLTIYNGVGNTASITGLNTTTPYYMTHFSGKLAC